jgi:RecA-family ATPase
MIQQTDLTNSADLLEEEYDELTHMVDDLIVPGVSLLAADPKSGKSYLMLYLSYCVATGQPAFGNKRAVKEGKVLYMALEDNNSRLQKRLKEIRKADLLASFNKPVNLDLFTRGKITMKDRFASLKTLIEANSYDMVVIDILQNIRKSSESRSYSNEYNLLKNLGDVAHATDTAIVVVHHTKKGGSKSPMQKVSGTQGLTGAADNIIVIERNGTGSVLDLNVKGRDVDEHQFYLEYGTDEGFYKQLNDPPTSRNKQAKMDRAWELDQQGWTQQEVAEVLGHKQPYVCKLLKAKREQLEKQQNTEE